MSTSSVWVIQPMPDNTLSPTQSEQLDLGVDEDTAAPSREVEAILDDGECPWCDEYSGDHPAQHASSAHRDEWREYTEGE